MRIISGYLKGKNIKLPRDKKTRPLRDLVKESIFNIIHHSKQLNFKFENSKVLDLFSGTGSFGLECISRGSSKVIFNENYSSIIEILLKNISNLDCEEKTQVKKIDCLNMTNLNEIYDDKFDLIFLDPPFKTLNIDRLIIEIKKSNILKDKGLIILHRHSKNKDNFQNDFNVFFEKNYGLSKIFFGT